VLGVLGVLGVLACGGASPPPIPANEATVPSEQPIAVQLAYTQSFMVGPPFTEPPPFTLLADGTLLERTTDPAMVVETKVGRSGVDRIVRDLVSAGFERL
jgi:hypothetical protein